MNPKVGGKMPVQHKIQIINPKTQPSPPQLNNTFFTNGSLRNQVSHIVNTPNQTNIYQRSESLGFQNQQSKNARMPNAKLSQLNSHFENKNLGNDVYEFRVQSFIDNAKKGNILNAEFIKDEDKERVLNELKKHFYA